MAFQRRILVTPKVGQLWRSVQSGRVVRITDITGGVATMANAVTGKITHVKTRNLHPGCHWQHFDVVPSESEKAGV